MIAQRTTKKISIEWMQSNLPQKTGAGRLCQMGSNKERKREGEEEEKRRGS